MTEGRKKQKLAYQVRQLGALEVLPRDILLLLFTYLDPNDILNVRQVSRALNQLVMDHPDHLPAIPVRLTIQEMYRVSDDFRSWIRNLTIRDSDLITADQLTYLVRAFPRLRKLSIYSYQVDLGPLRGLVNLQRLFLFYYQGNLGPLHGLRNIQMLYLSSYGGDLEPLRGLRDIRELYLDGYHGKNIEPLSDLVNLKKLVLNCYRDNIEPLNTLYNLQTLALNGYLGDLKPLRCLVNLKHLHLFSYRGDNIEPLRGLVNLRVLDLTRYQGDNIEPLRGLVKLQYLYLDSYQRDLGPLRGLVNLRWWSIEGHTDQGAVRELERELGI